MREAIEVTSAFVDLITGIILIPFCIMFYLKQGEMKIKKMWLILLILLSVGNIIGFFIHAFIMDEIIFDLIWIVLYPIMYGIVIAFVTMTLYTLTKEKHLTKKEFIIFVIITSIMSVISTIIGFFTVDEIRSFVVYAAITCFPCFIYHVYHAFKNKRKSSIILTTVLFPQLFGFYFQITKTGAFTLFNIPFNHDAIYHLCLLVSVVMFYFAGVADLNEKKDLSVD